MNSKPHIAFIGLGNMGAAMVKRLLAAGYPVTVFARRAESRAPLVALGAREATSAAQAAQSAAIVCTNVTATKDVEQVLFGVGGVHESIAGGSIVCDFSTISAAATRQMATRLAQQHVTLLDCPVSGGTKGANEGTLVIMVGGTQAAFNQVEPMLLALGRKAVLMGASGAGQVTKACNQLIQVVNIQGMAEALTLARSNAVDVAKVVEVVSAGFGGSKMLDLMGPKIANRDWAAGIESRLHQKDFDLLLNMANEAKLSLPATAITAQMLNAVLANGWGTLDTCNLARVVEKMNGLEP